MGTVLRTSGGVLFESTSRWVEPPAPDPAEDVVATPVTVADAIADLPPVTAHHDGTLKKGLRDLGDGGAVDYPRGSRRASEYVREHMWAWSGFESGPHRARVRAHVIRSVGSRAHRLFAQMEHGWQYPETYQLALRLFSEHVERLQHSRVEFPCEGRAVRTLAQALKPIVRELEQCVLQGLRARLEQVRRDWQPLRRKMNAVDRDRARYAKGLELLRCDLLHPYLPDLVKPLAARWLEVSAVLANPVADMSTRNRQRVVRARNRSLALFRTRDAYDKALVALGESGDTCVRVDADPNDIALASRKWLTGIAAHVSERAEAESWLERVEFALVIALELSYLLAAKLLLKQQFVPSYDPMKFPNKWRKMSPDEPARTLMAHLGKDTYSHIHYDSAQARMNSVREAARLQSFPDGFRFCGAMNPGFRQIGNAVPPLMAFALAEKLLSGLRTAVVIESGRTGAGRKSRTKSSPLEAGKLQPSG